jgi:hypothetical protein
MAITKGGDAQFAKPGADNSAAVDTFMAALEHPHKTAIAALSQPVLTSAPAIAEGIKWNAPSYRTTEYSATTHLRAKTGVGLILHLGAKARAHPDLQIADPESRLNWLARDRALLSFEDVAAVAAAANAVRAILRQWIKHV